MKTTDWPKLRSAALVGAAAMVLLASCSSRSLALDFPRLMRDMEQRWGSDGRDRLRQYQLHLQQWRQLPEPEKLTQINEFFNRNIRFVDDANIWGQADYWATPLETLGQGAGDCEDFTIAKYFALKQAGVDTRRLHLTYVRARLGAVGSQLYQAHMVLTYYSSPSAEPLILDNLLHEIRPASRRPDLTPVFSFNSEGIWSAGKRVDAPVERLSRWSNLRSRMQQEGFD